MKKNGYTTESYVLSEHSFYTYDSRKRPARPGKPIDMILHDNTLPVI